MSRIEKTVSEQQYEKEISRQKTGFDVVTTIWKSARTRVAVASASGSASSQRHSVGETRPKKAA